MGDSENTKILSWRFNKPKKRKKSKLTVMQEFYPIVFQRKVTLGGFSSYLVPLKKNSTNQNRVLLIAELSKLLIPTKQNRALVDVTFQKFCYQPI